MKFIIEYGSDGVGKEHLAIQAKTEETAWEYAHYKAREYRDSYEGMHGVLDYFEFCEENELDIEASEVEDLFFEFVENEIHYAVDVYDAENEEHQTVLEECNNIFFEV